MGLLERVETRASKGGSFFLSNPDAFALQLMGAATDTASGIHVTQETALEWSALASALRILCNTSAMVPLEVLQRVDTGKRRRRDLTLYQLLHDAPNDEMTAFDFRALIPCHTILWGNFYANVVRRNGQVAEIWPLNPDRVQVRRQGGRVQYMVTLRGGEERVLDAREVLHIPGFSSGGLIGRSMIHDHREAIGLGIATERYTARFFGNDATPGGYLTHPEALGDEAYMRLKKSWEDAHRGIDRSHRVAILEEGTEWKQVMVDPEKAQALGLKKFQVNEAIRIVTGVPPHLIGDLERATFSNVEEQSRNFVQFGLQPTATRIEQRMNLSLLTEDQRANGLFVEHQMQGLLRGSVEHRTAMYQAGLNHGWLTINDVRSFENLNSIGPLGDVPMIRMDMQPLDRAVNAPPPEPPVRTRHLPAEKTRVLELRRSRQSVEESFSAVFLDAMERISGREIEQLRKALKLLESNDEAGFRSFLRTYYFETLPPQIREIVLAIFIAYAIQMSRAAAVEAGSAPDDEAAREFATGYTDSFSNRYSASGRRQIEALIAEPGDSAEAVRQRLTQWEEGNRGLSRAGKVAREEVRTLGQQVARAAFVAAGAAFLVSRTRGDSCPYCEALDGKRVAVQTPFLREGELFQPEGADVPLTPSRNLFTPPYHSGCDCEVVPEI